MPWIYDHTCLVSNLLASSAPDPLTPAVNQAHYYLVSRMQGSCPESNLGQRTGNIDRPNSWPCIPFAADVDRDGVLNGIDNCVMATNPGQADADLDGTGDACDDD
jgi:hypothetical protein